MVRKYKLNCIYFTMSKHTINHLLLLNMKCYKKYTYVNGTYLELAELIILLLSKNNKHDSTRYQTSLLTYIHTYMQRKNSTNYRRLQGQIFQATLNFNFRGHFKSSLLLWQHQQWQKAKVYRYHKKKTDNNREDCQLLDRKKERTNTGRQGWILHMTSCNLFTLIFLRNSRHNVIISCHTYGVS